MQTPMMTSIPAADAIAAASSLTIGLLAVAAAIAAAAGLAIAGRRLRRLHAADRDAGDPDSG